MTQRPATPEEVLARLRTAAAADAAACAHLPAVLEAMLLALLLRLLGGLQHVVRTWRPAAPAAGLSRSRTRIAAGRVPPRAARPERFLDWWLRMNFGRGMRASAAPPVPPRHRCLLRAPPPEPAAA